jgi:hypothetical protein
MGSMSLAGLGNSTTIPPPTFGARSPALDDVNAAAQRLANLSGTDDLDYALHKFASASSASATFTPPRQSAGNGAMASVAVRR